MSEWKPIDKDGKMAVAPKGTEEPQWNKLTEGDLARAEVSCYLCIRGEDHSPHNWSRAGIPVRCPGFVEDVVREGDQPLPTPNDRPDIQSLVLEDIRERRNVGIQRYGTALQPHNGRDALRDAYEEALDLVMYLRQMMEERDGEQP